MEKLFGRAIIIGLGGSGQLALLRIKQMFLDHCEGRVPPCIKLLAFDTNINQEESDDAPNVRFDDDEYCHMHVRSVSEAKNTEFVQNWWIPYESIDSLSLYTGTGGIREAGRLAVFANIDVIAALLSRSFDQLQRFGLGDEMERIGMRLLKTTPQVFVICSFAGGTGSGAFIDFLLLCRELGSRSGNMFYSAFFVMPWVYRDISHTAFANGYAALLELEKLNRCSPGDPYTVSYTSNLSPSLTERPFHIINLVDGESRNGERILSYKELPIFIGDCIFNSVGAAAKSYASVEDNVTQTINLAQKLDWKNQQPIYSTFGTSTIVYPAKKIHELLSTRYAVHLLERVLTFLGESAEAQAAVDSVVGPFLAQNALGALMNRIVNPNTLRSFLVGDNVNLRDPNLKAMVDGSRRAWETAQRKSWNIEQNAQILLKDIAAATEKFLKDIKSFERTGKYPEGTYRAANLALLNHWLRAKDDLKLQHDAEVNRKKVLEDQVKKEGDDIHSKIPKGWRGRFSVNPVRIACSQYAKACTDLLRCELLLERISRALELCGIWADQANERESRETRVTDRMELIRRNLEQQKVRLKSELSDYSVENLMKQKALFEIYVGLEERVDKETGNKINVYWVPPTVQELLPPSWVEVPAGLGAFEEVRSRGEEEFAATIFGEFQRDENLRDRASFLGLSMDRLNTVFLEHARKKLGGVSEWSVLELLNTIEHREPGTIERLTNQALRYSSQLLPINENELTGRQKAITDFTIIGSHYTKQNTLEAVIGPYVPKPTPPKVENIWVNTGDRHRISITNYFSVIPLYVLRGVERAREEYLDRIRPPAHVDRNFEFRLLDILPRNRNEIVVLKLLSLAMLKCTGPIIERLKLPDDGTDYYKESHFYYRLNPNIFQIVSDEDLLLPGKPGKFYSLYTELCKGFNSELRDKLTDALVAADRPNTKQPFLDEVKAKYNGFQEILKSKNFNKMITGNLYRQQMTFFHNILRGNLSIRQALEDC